jgi:hypothetical protein
MYTQGDLALILHDSALSRMWQALSLGSVGSRPNVSIAEAGVGAGLHAGSMSST